MTRPGLRRSAVAWAFLAGPLVFYGAFIVYPWAQAVWISLYDWDGIGPATWVGLANYLSVVSEPVLRSAIVHAFGFIVFYTVVPLMIGLVLAEMVARRAHGRLTGVVRTVLFLPQVLPLVAVATVFNYLYGSQGPVNQVLGWIGIHTTNAWLGDFTWAYYAVGLVGTWVNTGLCMMLLLTGISGIDRSLYEAARVDGASPLREFWHVTVPGVRPQIIVAATTTIISALASFDVVYVMTGGGPGTSTIVPGVLIYQLVFTSNQVGLACALAVVLSVLIVGVVLVLNRLGRRFD